MRITRLTGTEAAVCVSRETAEKRSSAGENAEEKWTRGWVTSARRGVCFDVCRLRDFLGESTRSTRYWSKKSSVH